MKCAVCGQTTFEFARACIIDKYNICYFRCDMCKLIQTEEPYWLAEAYTKAINDSDIGLVNRNINSSVLTKSVILSFFDRSKEFIDYGGGYGLFVRMMRDKGFAFNLYDTFCENIFANGFEAASNPKIQYELLTAFEVFEHLVDPKEDIEKMLQFSDNILFTTLLFPETKPKPGEWWYYGLEHGQHVSLYSYETLKYIANLYNLHLYSNKKTVHLLTKKKLRISLPFQWVVNSKIARIIDLVVRCKSLVDQDYSRIIGSKVH